VGSKAHPGTRRHDDGDHSGCEDQGDDVWMVNGQYCTATLGKFVPVTDTESLRYIQDAILKVNIPPD